MIRTGLPVPAFRELAPDPACACPGCHTAGRQPVRRTAAPAPSCTRATRLGALTAVAGFAAAGFGAVQAQAAPAHLGTEARATTAAATARTAADSRPAATREQILARARSWVDAGVPYSQSRWYQGYRTDCSGFVSMAWGLGTSHWTGDLDTYGVRITKDELRPGDLLLFHNSAAPTNGSHAVLFGGWADADHTRYTVIEMTSGKGAVERTAPYAYFSHSGSYVPYRYAGLREGGGAPDPGSGFPGAGSFGPGAHNAHVTRLGTMLAARGGGRFYRSGPGPRWSTADEAATRAFQQAQGWSGADADGIPGAATWRLLTEGRGNDISGGSGGTTGGPAPETPGGPAPAFPGADRFGPGRSGPYVMLLGRQLVRKGFGASYGTGPGPTWSESDRRAVAAFQRAQGWSGDDADGYPGAQTWSRLFS